MELKWIILALAVIMYVLVIAFQDKKVWITTAAALISLLLGTIFPGQVFTSGDNRLWALTHSFTELINWNVLMIYVGSMTIAALFLYSKVPAKIADTIVKFSPSTGVAIVLILAMTGIISIFVENVATLLVMAPIALAMCHKLKMNPTYFMVGLAVMSNLEGTATLVGDPPSMIFAAYAGYNFNDFFFHAGKMSIFFFMQAGMLAGCVFFYFIFRKQKEKTVVDGEPIISVVPALLLLAMIFGLAGISFAKIELPFVSGGLCVLLGLIGLAWYVASQKKSGSETWELVKGLDWETIAFLIGIFVVVGAISETGLLADLAAFLARITGGSVALGFVLILAVSVIISGFVDNVPYIIVMLPVAGGLAEHMEIAKELYMFALLIGSCLGGNLSPYGASANVVSMGILKKEGYPLSFAKWLKIGGSFTLITTAVSAITLYLVWA